VLSDDFCEWQGASFECGFSVSPICESVSCSCPRISECIWKLIRPALVVKFFVGFRDPSFLVSEQGSDRAVSVEPVDV
jgi:hypothetical protein